MSLSYLYNTVAGEIVVPKANLEQADTAVDEYFHDEFNTCRTVKDFVSSLGFKATFDSDGNLHISEYCDTYPWSGGGFDVIAPYVTPDSRLAWVGEDFSIFIWTFEDGQLNEWDINPEALFLI